MEAIIVVIAIAVSTLWVNHKIDKLIRRQTSDVDGLLEKWPSQDPKDYAVGAITADKIVAGSISSAKLRGGIITAVKIEERADN